MEQRAIIPDVIDILKREFPSLRSMELTPDTRLLSTGLLDSFALVTLLAALESAFTINVDVDSIQIEEFETPRTIAGICQGASRGGRQGA